MHVAFGLGVGVGLYGAMQGKRLETSLKRSVQVQGPVRKHSVMPTPPDTLDLWSKGYSLVHGVWIRVGVR